MSNENPASGFFKGVLKVVVPIAIVGAAVTAIAGQYPAAAILAVAGLMAALGFLIPDGKG